MKKLECRRCGHSWMPRVEGRKPLACPNCNSRAWDRYRMHQVPLYVMDYRGQDCRFVEPTIHAVRPEEPADWHITEHMATVPDTWTVDDHGLYTERGDLVALIFNRARGALACDWTSISAITADGQVIICRKGDET